MKGMLLALCLAVSGSITLAADRNVIVPNDTTPFKAKDTDIVRIKGTTPSGGTVKAVVTGPAKIDATNIVEHRTNGQTPIGALIKEFEIKSTGKGKVTVTVTTTSPAGGGPTDTKYEYDVQ